jgi:hypothetical protein
MPNSAVTYGDLNLYTNPTNNWMTEAPGQLRNPITEARKNVLTSHRSFNCARKAFLEINNAHPFRAHRDSCHLRKHSLRLLHPSLALLLTKVSSRSGSVFWHYPSTVSTLALPRTCSTLWGQVFVSIVNATLEFWRNTFTFGAFNGVPSTISSPFQWNQMGTTRGVPSCQT